MALLLLPLVLAPAHATPEFPGTIADTLAMPCTPACTLCHETNAGGAGTVTQPFGEAMVARGLIPSDDASLADALAAMEADAVDSDGDGVTDVDALRDGANPNPGGADFCSVPPPQYGCVATLQAGDGRAGWMAPAVGAIVLASRRRRARRIASASRG
jgi:hypothetical protein